MSRFITFEGLDGAGKSTQLAALGAMLAQRGQACITTREPGGTALGESLRELLLHRQMTPVTELLLIFAARAEHVEATIRPALARGAWVLCDRFTDATIAYQCHGRGLPRPWVDELQSWAHPGLRPDLTLLFDIDPDAAASRRLAAGTTPDRFESQRMEFHRRVRDGYRALANAEPDRFLVLDATRPATETSAAVAQRVLRWLD